MKSKKLAIAGCILLAIISIMAMINTLFFREKNFTEEYSLFLELKELDELEEVRDTLSERKLEYKISDNHIVIFEFENVGYDILDTGALKISANTTMAAFETLDSEDLTKVEITGTVEKGEFHEIIELLADRRYIKQKGQYLMVEPIDDISFVSEMILLILANIGIVFAIKMPKKQPKKPNTP